jgi:hypothetical protein
VGLYFGDVDYVDVDVQMEIERVTTEFENGEWISSSAGVFSVHRSFRLWVLAQVAAGVDLPVNVTNVDSLKQVGAICLHTYFVVCVMDPRVICEQATGQGCMVVCMYA